MPRLRRWKKRKCSLFILRAGLKYVAPTALEETQMLPSHLTRWAKVCRAYGAGRNANAPFSSQRLRAGLKYAAPPALEETRMLFSSQRLRAGLKYVAPTALERGRAGTARRKGGGHSIPAAARNLRCPAPATWWSSWGTAVPALYAERREGTACRAPTWTGAEGGACRRRGLSRRGGVRRVRPASGGPGGRACAENPGPGGRPCACCIRCSRKPGCGRNCVRSAPVARRGRGTAR